MEPTTEQVRIAALGLPDADRIELIEALIESFESPDHPPFDESWRKVIRRRSAELALGNEAAVTWSEVKRRAAQRGDGSRR